MTAKIDQFKKIIWDYYRQHGRELPWRQSEPDGTFDPYKILVSEIMLQQTQVARVIPKYRAFLEQFPDIETLAGAALSDVLSVWSGLGYNRRAKYLHDAAKQLPKAEYWKLVDMLACKGIGLNTASAIVVYAYNEPLAFVETNIRTVYIHHFFNHQSLVSDKEILKMVQETVDKANPREFCWGLMDYGTYIKTKIGNTARLSKHYSKQSRFEDSPRQIRGKVLKLLIKAPLTSAQLESEIADERLQKIIADLETEHLITRHGVCYFLAS